MVESCGITSDGYSLLDEGTAIELDTKGEESFDSGTSDYVAYSMHVDDRSSGKRVTNKKSVERVLWMAPKPIRGMGSPPAGPITRIAVQIS